MDTDTGSDFLFAHPSFWRGIGTIIDLGDTYFVFNSSLTPQQADRFALFMDWRTVGFDIRSAMDAAEREHEATQGRLAI